MGALYMYISVFIAQICLLVASTAITWSSPMLVKLNGTDDNPLGYVITSTENSFLASSLILGAIIGSTAFGLMEKKFGRKSLLILIGFPFLLSNLALAFSRVIWIFFAARVVTGIVFGGVSTILPMYCGEIADESNRGILGASSSVFMNIGLLIPYSLGPYIPFLWFHIVLAVIPAVSMILLFAFAPESPYYLIKTDEAAAEAVLLKIRPRKFVPVLMKEMKENLKQATSTSIIEILRSQGLRKTLIIGFGGYTFMQLTGTSVVATYTQTIFEEAGGDISPSLCPILVGIAQLIMTVLVSSITDKYPRKFLLTLSHLLVGLVLIPFGAFFFLKKQGNDVSSLNWLPLVCLITYVCAFNIGVGPVLMIFLGELFPPKVKGIVISCMVTYSLICSFLITSLFNTLIDLLGIGILFWIFSSCNFAAVIFIKFCMIETKGKTLEQIQTELNS